MTREEINALRTKSNMLKLAADDARARYLASCEVCHGDLQTFLASRDGDWPVDALTLQGMRSHSKRASELLAAYTTAHDDWWAAFNVAHNAECERLAV